jgi:hypothetical protein
LNLCTAKKYFKSFPNILDERPIPGPSGEHAESTRHHMTCVTKRITNTMDISSIPRYVEDVSALMCPVLHCFEALIAKVIPKHM